MRNDRKICILFLCFFSLSSWCEMKSIIYSHKVCATIYILCVENSSTHNLSRSCSEKCNFHFKMHFNKQFFFIHSCLKPLSSFRNEKFPFCENLNNSRIDEREKLIGREFENMRVHILCYVSCVWSVNWIENCLQKKIHTKFSFSSVAIASSLF